VQGCDRCSRSKIRTGIVHLHVSSKPDKDMGETMKKELIADYLLITISSLLIALGVRLFFSEHMLAPGGITGMSIVVNALTGLPMEVVQFGISGPLLVLGMIFLGKSFGIKTLYITFMGPLLMKLIPQTHVTDSLLVASIAGGALVGTAIGIAILRGCATGGTDLMSMLINRVLKFMKLPTILFILDGTVVAASGLISRDIKVALFSLGALLVIIRTIAFVTSRFAPAERTAAI